MPFDRREVAALRNLGQVMLDPTLGFCEPLAARLPAPAGFAPSLEAAARAAWAPLFNNLWVPKPVRAFFRRVSLSIEEVEPFERTVSPDTQAWMILALCQAARRFGRSDPFWSELGEMFVEMAFRAARFGAEHLINDAGIVAARHFAVLDTGPADRLAATAYPQGLWLEALSDLHATLRDRSPDRADEVWQWARVHLEGVHAWLDTAALGPLPAAAKARLLQGLTAAQASPARYDDQREGWRWILIANLIDSQEPSGSWEGSARATAEVVAAIARAGRGDFAVMYPDALGKAIAWLQRMQQGNRTLPASMEGLRVWDYSLDDLGALLESGRQGAHALLHPDDHDTLDRMAAKWWGAALGTRCRLPRSFKYGGQWVAGFRYVRETKTWFRDLRIEPGAIARLAFESFAATAEAPQDTLPA